DRYRRQRLDVEVRQFLQDAKSGNAGQRRDVQQEVGFRICRGRPQLRAKWDARYGASCLQEGVSPGRTIEGYPTRSATRLVTSLCRRGDRSAVIISSFTTESSHE